MPGRWGGMAFQARNQVSLTHSSASCSWARMFRAMERQKAPYFVSLSRMACSDRAQYSSMIC